MDEQDFKKTLTEEEYHVLREAGTEAPFSGEYVDLKADGMYHCRACNTPLFMSDDKYDSGSGWPSFTKAVKDSAVIFSEDSAHGMRRIEARCAHCGSHLGHVFPDGPKEKGGQRFCINSLSLTFKEK